MKPCRHIAKPKFMNTSCNCALKIPRAIAMWIWSSLPTQWHQRPMVTWSCCPPENSSLKQAWFIHIHIHSMIQRSLRTIQDYQTTFTIGLLDHFPAPSVPLSWQANKRSAMSKANQADKKNLFHKSVAVDFGWKKLFEASDLNKTILQTGQCNVLSFYKSICWLCCMSVSWNTWFVVSNCSYIVECKGSKTCFRLFGAFLKWLQLHVHGHIFQDHVTNKNTSKNAASGIWKKKVTCMLCKSWAFRICSGITSSSFHRLDA